MFRLGTLSQDISVCICGYARIPPRPQPYLRNTAGPRHFGKGTLSHARHTCVQDINRHAWMCGVRIYGRVVDRNQVPREVFTGATVEQKLEKVVL